jgi:hypothetical protein
MKLNNPFDHQRFIGYVSKVSPDITQIHFPNSKLLKKFYYDGDVLHGGVVRNFVIIEGEGYGFLAKIISVELPEKERGFLSETAFQNNDKMHPIGKVEIQLSFEIFGELKAKKGLDQYPPVGAKVYACSPSILQNFLKDFGKENECNDLLEIATLPQDAGYPIRISANALFGRHCAIVGTTGGGKSYTIAKLLEEMTKKEVVKIILLDATGEFEGLGENLEIAENCHFHYKNLQDEDFFALFRPAGQVQLPKLQEAFKSLKVASAKGFNGFISDVESPEVLDGQLIKQGKKKFGFIKFVLNNQSAIEDSLFDIKNLSRQIYNECVDEWIEGKWGSVAQRDRDNCASLIMRINSLIFNENCNAIFNFQNNVAQENQCVINKINTFFSDKKKLLRINLRKIPKDSDISSVLVNAIGRFLLRKASSNFFKENPLVIFLDEAHLFLNKKIKDEYSIETELNAFERIAKECRKYGLFLCLSTQRPRDIPQGVLSQVGTFIAHRLINQFDRDAVENASPESSKYILSFLPSLKQGEAILMGVDFPMPINIKIKEVSEKNKPNSSTPKLFKSQL